MDLEEQIRKINNSQEFVKLCNTIFCAKYGNDFQVIDGTRTDQGNDGYIFSERRVLAIYCPIKPETRTDQNYINKIYKDLKKAKKLNDDGSYLIENWTFITPHKLTNNIIVKLRKKAESYNFEGNHIEATYLSNELYNYPHLIKKFPYLQISKTDIELAEIKELIKKIKFSTISLKELPNLYLEEKNQNAYKKTEDFKRVIKLITSKQKSNSKNILRSIYYQTTDKVAKINILLGLMNWYDPANENYEDMLKLCAQGIKLANELNEEVLKVLFLGNKGKYLSYKFSVIDLYTASSILMSNYIGLPLITEDQRQERLAQLEKIEEDFTEAFNEALEIGKKLRHPYLIADTLLSIGQAAGGRFIHLNKLGVVERASYEKGLSKRALLTARDIYFAIGDELRVGYALCNLAFQLFIFGEYEESMIMNKNVIEIAHKYNDLTLLQRCKWLTEDLDKGRVHDYVHGEGRELKI